MLQDVSQVLLHQGHHQAQPPAQPTWHINAYHDKTVSYAAVALQASKLEAVKHEAAQ
jgi:hypothetical protein